LYKNKYKIHFQSVVVDDVAVMAMAKVASMEKHLYDIHPDAWKSICDSFDADSWMVNKPD
jgi:hypothetical protein